jgi:GPH family glycoside/pentoside/hexuronide:cation symporter
MTGVPLVVPEDPTGPTSLGPAVQLVPSSGPTPAHRSQRLALLAYALPSVGAGCAMWLVTINLLRFGTETLLLAPAAVGLVFGAARIWDAISDPIAGMLSDRTRTAFGRRRLWMLASAVPLCLSFAALWNQPADLGSAQRLAWLTVFVLLFYTAQTTLRIPHTALAAELGHTPEERTKFFGARLAGDIAGMLLAIVALQAIENVPDDAGWIAWVLGIVGSGLVVAGALLIKEPKQADTTVRQQPYRAFAAVFRVPEARILLAAFFGQEVAWASLLVLIPFASAHVLQTPGETATYLGCVIAPMLLTIPLWARAARRHGKKLTWAVCNLVTAATFCLLYLAGPGDAYYVMAIAAMLGALQAGSRTLGPAVQSDLVAADTRRTGQHRQGTYFAVMNLVEKFAAGGAVGLTGVALGVIGIQPGETQTAEVTHSLRLLISLLPGALIALSAAILLIAASTGARGPEVDVGELKAPG